MTAFQGRTTGLPFLPTEARLQGYADLPAQGAQAIAPPFPAPPQSTISAGMPLYSGGTVYGFAHRQGNPDINTRHGKGCFCGMEYLLTI